MALQVYKDPTELVPMLQKLDYSGKDCMDYLSQNELFKILGTPIMFKYITSKQKGNLQINASFLQFSTSYNMMKDKSGFYEGILFTGNFLHHIYDEDQSDLLHMLRFKAFKKSIVLRNYIDSTFVLILTIIFLVYAIEFNKYITLSIHELHLLKHYSESNNQMEAWMALDYLKRDWIRAADDSIIVLHFTYYMLLFPLNLFIRCLFLY